MKAYLQTNQGLTVFLKGECFRVAKDHPYFNEILEGLNDDRVSEKTLVKKISLKEVINIEGCGAFKVVDNAVVDSAGNVLDTSLTRQLIKLLRAKKPVKFLVRFLENIYQNPSRTAIMELYDFLQTNELPITEDGCFLAYKSVDNEYKDWHTGTCDNHVGKVLEMPRNRVDDDRNRTCSYGYHVARYDYAKTFEESEKQRIVICKVNPKDVVSVPPDYNCAKLRTCKYKVVAEVEDKKDVLKDQPSITDEEIIKILNRVFR